MDNEKEILKKIIEKYNLKLGKDYFYVGASIIKRKDLPRSTEIIYCEDGLNDEEGIPYIMQSTEKKDVFNTDRIIVFYTNDLGKRYIVPTDGENYILVGKDIPDNVKNINYDKAKNIMHRKALDLKKEPESLSKADISDLAKRYEKSFSKGRMIVGGLFGSFVWGILISLFVIFMVAHITTESINETLVAGILIGGAVLFIVGAILITGLYIKLPAIRAKRFAYKNDFLVINCENILARRKICQGNSYWTLCRRIDLRWK